MKNLYARIDVPSRLRGDMLLKEAMAFDIPNTEKGIRFIDSWKKLGSDKQDSIMRKAYAAGISLMDAAEQE